VDPEPPNDGLLTESASISALENVNLSDAPLGRPAKPADNIKGTVHHWDNLIAVIGPALHASHAELPPLRDSALDGCVRRLPEASNDSRAHFPTTDIRRQRSMPNVPRNTVSGLAKLAPSNGHAGRR